MFFSILYSARYILLRGHQETFVTHDLYDQIACKFPGKIGDDICQKFKIVFSLMPVAAVVGNKILCVHSGISHEVKRSVDEWKKIPRTEVITRLSSITRDLLFSCPVDDDGVGADSDDPIFFISSANEYIKTFNEAAVTVFCEKTNIELIVRSHDAPPKGFRFFADKQLITIFSATTYNKKDNIAAFLRVDEEGVVSIVQMRPTEVTAMKPDDKKRKKSGETGKKSAKPGKKAKETPKKGSKEKTSDSKDNSKESKEENDGKKKKPTSKPSKELDSIYDNETDD
ncbi:hypothetical protein CRE_12470 [Caenorhabditis remanei]|uniref:Serine/threonine specific protein phosphatases domain-containing protein n=1 Tax=Caenorhabditis remanei TaxID=31234 RepID=E3M730_CAERE|nr:hypothetical protein CRE_12470 [Caenorhabditis remanei]